MRAALNFLRLWAKPLTRIVWFAATMLLHAKLDASCCSSAATGGVGRLLRHERALVELSTSTRLTLGTFDSGARFVRGHTRDMPMLTVEPELVAVTRLFSFFEPFVKLPVRIQKSSAQTGAQVADTTLGGRTQVLQEDSLKGLPSLTLLATMRLPTGTSVKDDQNLLPVDTSGTGAYLYGLSALLEKSFNQMSMSVGYGLAVEPDYFRKTTLSPGLIHAPLVAIAFTPHDGGLLSFTWSMMIFGQPRFQSRVLTHADQRKMTVACAYSIGIHSHIKLNAQLGSDLPFDYIGKNFTSEAFVRLGFRFGVF